MSGLAVVYSRASLGVQSPLVMVEAHISNGLPGFTMVGLPETAVKESKDRVRSALINSQFEFPAKRITINLAPADLPKEGGRFDLPIALGILAATGQLSLQVLQEYEFAGELALSGELRPIHGVLPFALGTREAKRALLLPLENAFEAALPGDNCVYGAKDLLEVYKHLIGQKSLKQYAKSNVKRNTNTNASTEKSPNAKSKQDRKRYQEQHLNQDELAFDLDLADVRGQPLAKRALEIAAAGGHNLLMIGPPGTGKTMLASRLPSIMPKLNLEESLEVIAIYSLISNPQRNITFGKRPFRAPHHTASAVALVGGGSHPRPGEISLAHQGVLFLDELPEFDRKVLEVLREPLESGTILISRAARQIEFPARFQLIAAMNPCPCGHLNDPRGQCHCTQEQISRYRTRISGPLLDRIDMHIEVSGIAVESFIKTKTVKEESSADILKRVGIAIKKQYARASKLNARLSNPETLKYNALDESAQQFMSQAMETLGLSARSYHRVLKLARTIADLSAYEGVEIEHLTEALSLRKMDRTTRLYCPPDYKTVA